jgi:hypothetical protein
MPDPVSRIQSEKGRSVTPKIRQKHIMVSDCTLELNIDMTQKRLVQLSSPSPIYVEGKRKDRWMDGR